MATTESGEMKVGVVVPVRDEEQSIPTLLAGLLQQTRLPDEIVIADAGSQDATAQIIQNFIDEGSPIKLIRAGPAMPGRGRNVAVAHCDCEWIAFTDAGIRPARDWLELLAEKVGDGFAVDVVYGSYEPVVDTFFKECAAIAYLTPPEEVEGVLARSRFIASTLMRRKVWETVGGFPEDLRSAEDLLFMRKVERGGFRTVRAPRAVVYWNIQPTLCRTFKRFVTYSRNNIRAGLFAEWQGTIFIYYAIIAASTLMVFAFGRKGLVGPPMLWLLLLFSRATKALSRNRRRYPAGLARNIVRACLVAPILAVADAAAFIGSIDWLIRDKLGLGKAEGER